MIWWSIYSENSKFTYSRRNGKIDEVNILKYFEISFPQYEKKLIWFTKSWT